MAKVTIRYPEMTPEEARQKLHELRDRWDPEESLASLLADMNQYEAQYGMTTLEFYAGFVAGKMGDSRDFVKWAGYYEGYGHLVDGHFSQEPAMDTAAR